MTNPSTIQRWKIRKKIRSGSAARRFAVITTWHCLFLGARSRLQVSDSLRHSHQRLDAMRNIGIGRQEMAGSPFRLTTIPENSTFMRAMPYWPAQESPINAAMIAMLGPSFKV
jgi:hypothetical protein